MLHLIILCIGANHKKLYIHLIRALCFVKRFRYCYFRETKMLSNEDHSATENINNRLRKLDHKISELKRYWAEMEQTGQPPSVTPRFSKSAYQSYPLDQRSSTLPPRLSSQGQGQRSQTLPSGSRSSLGQGRTDSINRRDIPKFIRKGPANERRRTAEFKKGHRSRPSDQSDEVVSNGHSANEGQARQEPTYVARPEPQPHVSQSYYPRSEDFLAHIPQSSYSYNIPMETRRSASPLVAPVQSSDYSDYRQPPDQPSIEDQIIQRDSYTPVQSQYSSQPMYQASPYSTHDDRSQPSTQPSSHNASFAAIQPEVSNTYQSQPDLMKPEPASTFDATSSSKYMVPDTLPITKSTPDLSKPPSRKVDIMPKFHLSRRAESPPKSFQELLTKFQTGETTEKTTDNGSKQEVQKEISQVLKSRASYLDDEDKVLDKRRPPDLKREIEEVRVVIFSVFYFFKFLPQLQSVYVCQIQ